MKYILLIFSAAFIVSCTKESANSPASTTSSGKGGSLAKFTIAGNRLYLVDDASLKTFDISSPTEATLTHSEYISFGIETIYSYNDKLFIGSWDGMYIYSIANPDLPVLLGQARHTRSCDPVVANDSIAFVTLRGNQACGPANDGLYIYNIKNILSPAIINTQFIPTPHGLGLQDSVLYVCQKENGMSIYNVNRPSVPVLRKRITSRVFEDVICYGNLLICYISNGIALYDISVPANPVELSVLTN